MNEIERLQMVNKWFDENHYMFKLEALYGLDIVAEIHQLIKMVDDTPAGKFAVFELLGDEVDQQTVWLDIETTLKYLGDYRARKPENYYAVFQSLDI